MSSGATRFVLKKTAQKKTAKEARRMGQLPTPWQTRHTRVSSSSKHLHHAQIDIRTVNSDLRRTSSFTNSTLGLSRHQYRDRVHPTRQTNQPQALPTIPFFQSRLPRLNLETFRLHSVYRQIEKKFYIYISCLFFRATIRVFITPTWWNSWRHEQQKENNLLL